MRLLYRQSKGQVLVLLALTMFMLLAVIALAIDIGRAYGVKAKLNAAVDAASFEAANSLAEGDGESGMKARAEVVAKEGQAIKKDDVIARLDTTLQDATVKLARAKAESTTEIEYARVARDHAKNEYEKYRAVNVSPAELASKKLAACISNRYW